MSKRKKDFQLQTIVKQFRKPVERFITVITACSNSSNREHNFGELCYQLLRIDSLLRPQWPTFKGFCSTPPAREVKHLPCVQQTYLAANLSQRNICRALCMNQSSIDGDTFQEGGYYWDVFIILMYHVT